MGQPAKLYEPGLAELEKPARKLKNGLTEA